MRINLDDQAEPHLITPVPNIKEPFPAGIREKEEDTGVI